MRKALFILVVLIFSSCKKEREESFGKLENTAEFQQAEDLGKEIFNGKGACIACHQVDEKLIGPSLQNIAKIYKEKNGDIVQFLKGANKPIVDPSQYELMQASLTMTKTFSDQELKALEAYIFSTSK